MKKQANRTLWIILAGVGCVMVVCLCVLVVGILVYFRNASSTITVSTPPILIQPATRLEQPTVAPPPTEPPTQPPMPTASLPTQAPSQPPVEPTPTTAPPTTSSPTLTGNQHSDEYSLVDDFSSDALGWPVYDDGDTILKYEDGAYSFQIAESDYYDWAYFPVDFIPYEINFDVYTQLGPQDGTFGVFCHLQDAANYYYIEFDAASGDYLIGQVVNDEDRPLTEENAQGQYWQYADPFNTEPGAANHIGVGCYLDVITLFVNGQFVDDIIIQQPFADPGQAAFFVYTYDFASPQGYKVWFDNVETYQPRQ
jgi:hypothetical protein